MTDETMKREVCGKCGRPVETGGVQVASVGLRCYPCWNEDMAARMQVDFDNSVLQPVVLADADGIDHVFEIRSMLVATGHEMFATEVPRPDEGGYEFKILGDFEDDALDLFQQLYEKMRREMAVKHVERGEYGWRFTSGDRFVGRIQWDPDSDMPLIVIDGRPFAWEELGRILMSFEGFTLRAAIEDSIEMVGGPLVDDPDLKT